MQIIYAIFCIYLVLYLHHFCVYPYLLYTVLGPTDPTAAPEGSLRNMILKDWEALGLAYEPNTGDNCVHASASPFEGLAERMNWLKADVAEVSM